MISYPPAEPTPPGAVPLPLELPLVVPPGVEVDYRVGSREYRERFRSAVALCAPIPADPRRTLSRPITEIAVTYPADLPEPDA